jgi:arylsulfatase A-like enzyme
MTLPENWMPEHPFDNGELRIRDELLAKLPRDPAETRQHLADYSAMIAHQDYHMGCLVDRLDALGLGEETLVIYTSDHGLAIGRHGLMGKQNVYEHALRIPLILRGPGIPADSVPTRPGSPPSRASAGTGRSAGGQLNVGTERNR